MKQLLDTEITPKLTAWSIDFLHSPAKLGDMGDAAPGIVGRIETHTNGTAENPAPHPHRGVTLYWADATRAFGTDISAHQGHVKLTDPRLSFVFIKAIEGVTGRVPTLAEHHKVASDQGLLRGAYAYYRAAHSGLDQAQAMLDCIGNLSLDLPMVLDVEVAEKPYLEIGKDVLSWLLEVRAATKRRPLVYTGPSFWSAMPFDLAGEIGHLADLWIAHYGVSAPLVAKGWFDWRFWQTTGTGRVGGIDTPADVDVFNGTVTELRAYAGLASTPVYQTPSVLRVQRALNLWNPTSGARLVADGIMGPKTISAVKRFQHTHGLPETGTVDAHTASILGL